MVSRQLGNNSKPQFVAKWASTFDAKANGDYVLTIGETYYEDVKLTITVSGN